MSSGAALRLPPDLLELRGGFRNISEAWHSLAQAEWPRPHPSDSQFSHLRLYVYDFSQTDFSLTSLLKFAASLSSRFYGKQDDCLVRYCEFGLSTPNSKSKSGHVGRPWVNVRSLTSEIPVLLRLLQVCTLVDDPLQADGFLVPLPLATLSAIQWLGKIRYSPAGPDALKTANLVNVIQRNLIHLNPTSADRHIFTQSLDSIFIGVDSHARQEPSSRPLIPNQSIVMHLGDDLWQSRFYPNARRLYGPIRRTLRFGRSIILPQRSQHPRSPSDKDWSSAARPLLVFGAFGMERHPGRRMLAREVQASEHLAPGRLRVGDMRYILNSSDSQELSFDAAYEHARQASFCLCPSGDAPSFTQRFYQAVFAGCIPVFVDLYLRYPADVIAYPFPSRICWRHFVVEVPENRSALLAAVRLQGSEQKLSQLEQRLASDAFRAALEGEFKRLVPRLQQLEPHAAVARRYMRSIASVLKFDAHAANGELLLPDAASAALQELAVKLGIQPKPPDPCS